MIRNFGRFLEVPSSFTTKRASSIVTNASNTSYQETGNGTITPRKEFHGEQAARNLQEALTGVVDTQTVIDVITSHTNRQRQAIRRHYRLFTDKELQIDVTGQLGGYIRDLSLMLLQLPMNFLAVQVHSAITNVVPQPDLLVELLWGYNNEKINKIMKVYVNEYNERVQESMLCELPSDMRILVEILVSGDRDSPSTDVDLMLTRQDAQMLVAAGVGRHYGTDKPPLLHILRKRSYHHLQEMLEQYSLLSVNSIEENISAEFKGCLKFGLIAIVKMIQDPISFLVEQINKYIDSPIPKDEKLMCLLVARSEVDLSDIKDCYVQRYGTKLTNEISKISSGYYRYYLIRLLGQYEN